MNIQCVDFYAEDAAIHFTQSLKETGFAVIKDHPIDQQLIEQVYARWFEFFLSDDKYQYPFDHQNHDGFAPITLSETAKGYDIKEYFHFYVQGRCPKSPRDITLSLYNELNTLAQTLLQWVEAYSPESIRQNLSMPLCDMIKDSEKTLYRILHYPPLTGKEEEGAIRAAAHEDINLLTLLPAATAKGLQVLSQDNKWFDVPCDPNWIIVNTGDMLAECTDNYYVATTHQVVNPTGEAAKQSRLSMPLFLHPRREVRLSKRHTAQSYCEERYGELGLL